MLKNSEWKNIYHNYKNTDVLENLIESRNLEKKPLENNCIKSKRIKILIS